MNKFPIYHPASLIGALFLSTAMAGLARAQEAPELTLASALERAIAADPVLRVVDEAVESAAGQVEQAGLQPNPVFSAELENFLGTGDFQVVDGVEVTLGVRQLIETAQKRQKRTAVARSEQREAAWQAAERLYDLRGAVRQAFAAVVLAQDLVQLRADLLELARSSEAETARLVDAARVPDVDRTRAQLAVSQSEFALEQARSELLFARSRLAMFWGEREPAPFSAAGEVEVDSTLPGLDTLAGILPRTAPIARFNAVEETRRRALELEQARATPDIEVFAGARYARDVGDGAFVAGVDIPWPLSDRNQGNIRSAQARLRAVEHEREVVRRDLLVRLTAAYRRLAAAHTELGSIAENLAPAADETLAQTEALYESGQYTLLNVIESRRVLFEIREARLDALRRFADATAEITALTQTAEFPSESSQ